MEDKSLTWYPLYWVYNDFWKWTYTKPLQKGDPITYPIEHAGHIHFFMLDFPVKNNPSQQAYYGEQKYTFELTNNWGEESTGPNKQNNIRVIGRPKWYFHITEYWRRIYIQDWDDQNNTPGDGVTGKKGIKYEASKDCHSKGPYREGKDNYFFSTKVNRTLPVEYWHNTEKTVRDHYLRRGNGVNTNSVGIWDFGNLEDYNLHDDERLGSYPRQKKERGEIKPIPGQTLDQFGNIIPEDKQLKNEFNPKTHPWENYFENWDNWTIPRDEYCKGDSSYDTFPGTVSYSDEDKARWNYPDKYFISPIIEYQKVTHANWERLEGWQERDVDKEVNTDGIETGEDFGDDWSIEVTSPFKIKGVIQSPFSDDYGRVYPAGVYCHDLDKQGKIKPLKYNKKTYDKSVTNEDWQKEGLKTEEIEQIALSMNNCLPDKELAYNKDGDQCVVKWNFPEGFPEDGKWVEQCLGAMVIAKARVVLEDNFGRRSVQWVEKTSFSVGDVFEGRDYDIINQANYGKPTVYFTKNNLETDPVTKKKTLVLNNTVINQFTIFDNDGIKRGIPQTQVESDAQLDFTGVNVEGTWSIVFPK